MMRYGKALKIRRGRISERRRRKLPQTSGKRVRLVMLASFAPLSIRSRVLKRNVQAHETERLAGRGGGLRGTPRSFFQPTAVRLKTNFVRRINVICPVQMAAQGCFALPAAQIKLTTHPSEGRLENVTDAGWDAVDALAARDEGRSRWTAKSCGPGAPTLALRSRSLPRTTGAKEPGPRGERDISR